MTVLVDIRSARGRLVTETVDAVSTTEAAVVVMKTHLEALGAFPFAALSISAVPVGNVAQPQTEGSKAA